MKILRIILSWLIGRLTIAWRWSCHVEHHDDALQPFLKNKEPFVVAVLHAHMIIMILAKVPHSTFMVSRSKDGDFLAEPVRAAGIKPIRGSTRKNGKSKGGAEALSEMSRLLKEESYTPILTVDGPRGPRNFVNRGVAILALEHNCPVIPLTPVATKTRILKKTWDQAHVPLPLSTIHMHWGEPLYPERGESSDSFRTRIGQALRQAELKFDPLNAQTNDESKIQFV